MGKTGSKGVGGHQRPYQGETDSWLTPPELLARLGNFDLDPCACPAQPWSTARRMVSLPDGDGLEIPWEGRVWLNPPYGPRTGEWLRKLAEHGNGVALVFARTETDMFHRWVWEKAHSCLFLEGRLHFHRPDGTRAPFNAGAPSCLVAYGLYNALLLAGCGVKGKFVSVR